MRSLPFLILGCTALIAQNGIAQDADIDFQDFVPAQIVPVPAALPYVPLTLGQNYMWSLHHILAPGRLFVISMGAAIDHSGNRPSEWGQGSQGYAERVGSRLGRAAVRENMAFAIRALDREDPRYFRSTSAGVWKRARYAASRTFVAKSESGGTMPAYSTLTADFATPFIVRTWQPGPIRMEREFRGGAVGLGVAAAGNIGQEFWPDIRKKLHR